jgi:6-phosphofructokinase|tara:strand:+ start:4219 stop:4692 length:474 start_codon:yes stop_codon:yes gene_type:complete
MYGIEIQIERAQLTPRKHGQLMKEINRRVMERHVTQRLPNHFEESAHSEYGARPRSAKYNKVKMRKYEHKKPNVFSGHLQQSIRTSITATQYGAKLTIKASYNPKKKKQSRMADWQKREIAVMSNDELKQEQQRQASEYKRGATSDKYRRKRKRRIK